MQDRKLIEPSLSKSPAWTEAKDGYETRLVSQLRQALADAEGVAKEIDTAMMSHSYRLLLEEENRELRKLVDRITGLTNAPILKEVAVVAETSGDVIRDVVFAVSAEMEQQGYASPVEVRSPSFVDAVRRRLKERSRAKEPPIPKELRK